MTEPVILAHITPAGAIEPTIDGLMQLRPGMRLVALVEAARPAPAVQVPEGYTLVQTYTLQWLLGEYGDFFDMAPVDGKPRPYFWRDALRKAMLAAPDPAPVSTEAAATIPAWALPVFEELEKAMAKFPTWPTDPLHALAVLGEEFGELTKDMLQLVYEPHKTSPDHVRTEARQTAAMALRLFRSLERYRYLPGEQHDQGEADHA